MARTSTAKSPQDVTGAKDDAINRKVIEDAKAAAAEAEAAKQAAVAELEEIEDLTEEIEAEAADPSAITLLGTLFKGNDEVDLDDDELDLSEDVDSIEATRVVRVAVDLPQVTIGIGNTYSFRRGKKYKVPKNVADHLEEKGLLWGQY